MPARTHDEYFASATAESQELARIQSEVESRIPDATRCISYGMPAFRQRKVFFHFAAFKKHIGVYPPVTDDIGLIEETKAYRGPKGNLSFPFAQGLPIALIGKVAVALSRQHAKP